MKSFNGLKYVRVVLSFGYDVEIPKCSVDNFQGVEIGIILEIGLCFAVTLFGFLSLNSAIDSIFANFAAKL